MLEHLERQGVTGRLGLVRVDRGGERGCCTHARPAPRPRGPRLGCGTTSSRGLPPHPARLARRGRPRPPRTLAPPGEVVREHHHLGDRLAPCRLHRDDTAPPVPRTAPSVQRACRGVSDRQSRACAQCGRSGRLASVMVSACPVWMALPMRDSPGSDAVPMATSTNSASPAENRPGRSSTVSTDGTRIGWITKGRGKPLMLVHGGGQTTPGWSPLPLPHGQVRRPPRGSTWPRYEWGWRHLRHRALSTTISPL